MKTKCTSCIHRSNFDHDCKQHQQTTDEWKGLLIVLSCTGYEQQEPCQHPASTVIHEFLSFPRWNFYVCRCDSGCSEVFVKVEERKTKKTIATLPTEIKPYCTGAPQHGYSYYYRWDGLNHSTPPIAPRPTIDQTAQPVTMQR